MTTTDLLTGDAPVEIYESRAAHSEPCPYFHDERLTALPAATTFFNDISEFQPVVDSQYPFHVLSIRADTGWREDNHAQANWNFARRSKQIAAVLAYVVCIPGQEDAIVARVKKLFGAKAPAKLALMVDMESGAGFAGPGDHSASGNKLVNAFASYLGNKKRVVAYANKYDFQSCWPSIPSWVKKITAAYTAQDPGTWGWQYAGGSLAYPVPAGYPRSAPPFGTWVDFNVVHRTIPQLLSDLGLSTPRPKPAPKPKYKTYKVRSGDTLGSIARRYHVTWRQLVTWNRRSHPSLVHNPNIIQIGWILKVSK